MDIVKELNKILWKNLDYKTTLLLGQRVDAMIRTLKFLQEQNNEHLMIVLKHGWHIEKLEAICCLSVFYQIVLGPLVSSAHLKNLESGIVNKYPIKYGHLDLFDKKRALILEEVDNYFKSLIGELKISFWWLQASHAEDLIYRISMDIQRETENE
ncbi:MAG: hypothetical protein ACPLQO_10745 [Desulfotomaculales bacterium]